MVCCADETYGYGIFKKTLVRGKGFGPILEKKHHKYFLRFTYTEEVSLNKTPVKEQTICSVDLGINTDAVCTIMRPDGTILGRKFINFPSDKDRMYRMLGRIRRFQREHGSRQVQGRWAYAKRLNIELGRKIAKEIVFYASENKADVIVFEYLEMKGKLSGKKKQKLQMWRKCDIQKRCGQQAHRKGIRISLSENENADPLDKQLFCINGGRCSAGSSKTVYRKTENIAETKG